MKSLKFTQKEWDSIKQGTKNIKIDPSLDQYADSEFAKEKNCPGQRDDRQVRFA
jgi:hypothetical protein